MKKLAMPALVCAATACFSVRPAFDQTPQQANAALAAKLAGLCRDKVQRPSLQSACLAVAENFRRGGDPSAGLDFAPAPQGGDIEVGGPWGTIVLRAVTGANGIARFVADVNGRDDPSVVVVPPQASTSPSRGSGGGGRGGGGGGGRLRPGSGF